MSNIYAYGNRLWKEIKRFEYTGESEQFTLDSGEYLVQCHGAHGGGSSTFPGLLNLGGSSFGILNLPEEKTMYAYVGGHGTSGALGVTGTGGFNGGGSGGAGYNSNYIGGSGGGGATDIRLHTPEEYGEPTGHNLPSIYTELEYVESRGNGFFETSNVNALTPSENLSIEIMVSSDDADHDMFVFGSRIGVADGEYCLVLNNYSGDSHDNPSETGTWANAQFGNLGWNSGSRAVDPGVPISTPAVYKMTSTGLWVNGNRIQEFEATNKNLAWRKVWIFTLMQDGNIRTDKNFYGRFYYMKTYTNDVLTGEWYPCRRNSDNVLGIYDKISNTFLPPYSSGILYPGSDVIDTRFTQSLNTRIMVAGGGGGSPLNSPEYSSGIIEYSGIGGGAVGGCVSCYSSSASNKKYATQNEGYQFGIGENGPSRVRASINGVGGGGGGWYGGYSVADDRNDYRMSGNGGGGSGYVLTTDSYKPSEYAADIPDISDYFMTSPYMTSGVAIDSFISISVPVEELKAGDIIYCYSTRSQQSFDLSPGRYKLYCWGGDGGIHASRVNATRGGYAEGILSLQKMTPIHVNVGGAGVYDCLISRDYVFQLKPDLSWNGGGTPAEYGTYTLSRSGGGATDIRLTDDSLYSRVIVAGGCGGSSDGGFGGAGGGESGGNANGTQGTNAGPGTQTGSGVASEYQGINGGFGYGGNGYSVSGYNGGAGGSGWYGGSGTYPRAYYSVNRSGAGGSGYVLTAESYKPIDYKLDQEYYLSDTVLTLGGNDLPYGVTLAKIECLEVLSYRVLCRDMYGIKGWDPTEERWYILEDQELTPELFNEHGVFSIESDEGLDDTYEVLVYDPSDMFDKVSVNVVPNKQTITCETITSIPIQKMKQELEFDPSIYDIEIKAERKITDVDIRIKTTITIDKLERSNSIPKLYYIMYMNE